MDKKSARVRRAAKTRYRLKKIGATRLVIHKTSRHIYAQVIASNGHEVLASAATTEKNLVQQLSYTGNKDAAVVIGRVIAKRALKKEIKYLSFDRSGFRYHGRIKALADSAREIGLQF